VELLVLDSAQQNVGPDPFRELRDYPLVRGVFAQISYHTGLEDALARVRRQPNDMVMVVGPSFLKKYCILPERLKDLLAEIGLPLERLVVVRQVSELLPCVCEYRGKPTFEGVAAVVCRAADFQSVDQYVAPR